MLPGYPQSHLMWHAAAPLLAERHTVAAADLTARRAAPMDVLGALAHE